MIWIDPHITSFTFKPISYYIKGITSLPQKHVYLSKALQIDDVNHFYFTNKFSSIPKHRFVKKISLTLFKLLIKIETRLWIKVNKLKKYKIHDQLEGDVFFFGFQYLDWNNVQEMVSNPLITKIFIHLNHYHTLPEKKDVFSKKIFFCCDFNILESDFFKYPKYNNPIIEVPFEVQNRFYSPDIKNKRETEIAIIGSYTLFDKNIFDTGIYTHDNKYATIHPIRYALSQHTFKDNVLYNQKEMKNGLFEHKTYYTDFDMVELMANTSCIVCGSEGNGILGISTLEALAMGCFVFMDKKESKLLGIEGLKGVHLFDDISDLLNKIDTYDSRNHLGINRDKLRSFASKYLAENLIDSVRSNLNLPIND